MPLQEAVQLRDVLARHVGARPVQHGEGPRDLPVVERVELREQLAADHRVDVVAAVPEAPFAAEVGGWVDGGGGLAG